MSGAETGAGECTNLALTSRASTVRLAGLRVGRAAVGDELRGAAADADPWHGSPATLLLPHTRTGN